MKRFLCCSILVALLVAGTMIVNAGINFSNSTSSSDEAVITLASSASSYTITCYRFSQYSKARCRGEYDPDSKTLTVHGETYRVQKNPYYGDGSKEGEYQYKAGPYYFDL